MSDSLIEQVKRLAEAQGDGTKWVKIEFPKVVWGTIFDFPALLAELERKDAALRKVLPWLERETPPQYVGVNSEGLPVEYEPTAAEEACGMAAMVILEALQPKEPPCQTA